MQARIFLLLAYLFHSTSLFSGYNYKLGALLIFRDEAPYLKEWIEYHKLLGVQKFYCYNNLSQDDPKKVLKPYIDSGEVELLGWDMESTNNQEWNACQCLAYTDGMIRALKDKVKWLCVIDSDEFLVPRTKNTLLEVLKPYEKDHKLGGVRVMWVMFGTSNVKKIPENKLLIESLTLNEGYKGGMWKSICRPDRVNCGTLVGCHTPEYLYGYHDAPLSFEEMQCNHYWTRDEDYLFNIKIPRKIKLSDGVSLETCLEWNESFNKETVAGEAILKFIPALRKKMGLPLSR